MQKTNKERAEVLAAIVASEGITIGAAAKRIGIKSSTGYQLSRGSHYRAALSRKLLEQADTITTTIVKAQQTAIATLVELLASDSPSIRLEAAGKLMSLHARTLETLSKIQTSASVADACERSISAYPTITPSRN